MFLCICKEYINVTSIIKITFTTFNDKKRHGESCKITYGDNYFIKFFLYDNEDDQPKDKEMSYEDLKKDMALVKRFVDENIFA